MEYINGTWYRISWTIDQCYEVSREDKIEDPQKSGLGIKVNHSYSPQMLPSPRPWDFPPSIDGDISRADDPMELDDPE